MRALLVALVLLGAHCFNIEPTHAKDTHCTTSCRRDSGGHLICHTRCH